MIKKLFLFTFLSLSTFALFSCEKDNPQPNPNPNPNLSDTIIVSGPITQNTIWDKDTTYILKGVIYVKNGVNLTIQPGTTILGDKATKGTLVITRGSKLFAEGTPTQPIVFTSAQPDSMRSYGDWGGLVILGNATINVPGGTATIEGGLLGSDAVYGGSNDDDNSGILRYLRIEYAGIAYQPNSELNALTFGGVGRGTIVENIQISYSGDDAFEWFGGTVNCKHLVAYKTWDDDFDTDFGYRGMVQFGLVIRDHQIADQSQSNSFESDNDGTGTTNSPQTAPVFSNITVVGPKQFGTPAILYRRAMHLRRNTSISIYNSIFIGFPTGLHIDGSAAQTNATNNNLQIENVALVNMTNNFEQNNGSNSWAGANDYFFSSNRNNRADSSIADVGITPNYTLTFGSPLMNGATFNNPKLNNQFFLPVTYMGAFGMNDWLGTWTKF